MLYYNYVVFYQEEYSKIVKPEMYRKDMWADMYDKLTNPDKNDGFYR
jgi:hypothetical protein